jgi:hypothetical protein
MCLKLRNQKAAFTACMGIFTMCGVGRAQTPTVLPEPPDTRGISTQILLVKEDGKKVGTVDSEHLYVTEGGKNFKFGLTEVAPVTSGQKLDFKAVNVGRIRDQKIFAGDQGTHFAMAHHGSIFGYGGPATIRVPGTHPDWQDESAYVKKDGTARFYVIGKRLTDNTDDPQNPLLITPSKMVIVEHGMKYVFQRQPLVSFDVDSMMQKIKQAKRGSVLPYAWCVICGDGCGKD